MSEISLINRHCCTDKLFMTVTNKTQIRSVTFIKWIIWGLAGGLIGTVIMDIVIAGFFKITGMPVDLIYSFIGDVVGRFLLMAGINIQESILLGASVHFLLGLGLGSLLGVIVSKINAFRGISLKKGIIVGIIYIEIVSQPILATAPLLKDMTASGIFQWYALSTVMHSIYGIILGGILSYKQKKAGFNE